MKVFAVDPGTTTGVAWYDDTQRNATGGMGVMQGKEIASGCTYKEPHGGWRQKEYDASLEVVTLVLDVQPDAVVIEDFILQPGKSGEYRGGSRAGLSADRIGQQVYALLTVMSLEGEFSGVVLWQTPSQRAIMTSARMRAGGYWLRGGKGHMRDAARHALVAYRNLRAGGAVRKRGSGYPSRRGTV